MRLAINYTPQAAALLDSGQIELDLYKCPDWPDLITQAQQQRPVYVHFPLHAGNGNMASADWALVDRLFNETDTAYINIHLAPHRRFFPDMPLDTRDPAWIDPLAEHTLQDIYPVIERFGRDRIILENVPYDPVPAYGLTRVPTLPAFITRIVEETGCGLLLDTAHARIAALYLDMDPLDYIDALPAHALRELHVTGTIYREEVWQDHFPMTPPDWALLQHVVDHIQAGDWPQPDIIALEYGGVGPMFEWRSDSAVIAQELPRIRQMLTLSGESTAR